MEKPHTYFPKKNTKAKNSSSGVKIIHVANKGPFMINGKTQSYVNESITHKVKKIMREGGENRHK